MEKINISKFDHCYGCGVCVAVCPVKIIDFKENAEGFYEPYIEHQEKCINCGLCLKVCAFNHEEVARGEEGGRIESFAAYSKDEIVRQRCSSGGIGFEVGKFLLNSGYKACGVRYNPNLKRAEHFIADNEVDFRPSVGSKYIPSFTTDAFSQLNRKEKYLVTGTPCQIDSFRRYIRHFKVEDNFVLLDFFCHGVPSLLLWDKYLGEVEEKIGESTFVSWRNKTTGWQDSWAVCADTDSDSLDWHNSYNLEIREKKHFYQSRMTAGDLFFRFFLGNVCLNKCCYKECKYKMSSSAADIRIGDLWGHAYASDNKGTSAVLSFTKRGEEILKKLSGTRCDFKSEPAGVSMEGQMPHSPAMPWVRGFILEALRSEQSLGSISAKWYRMYQVTKLPRRIINKLKRELKKLLK